VRVVLARVKIGPRAGPSETRPMEHLGLAYLAGSLRRGGHTVEIVDAEVLGLREADLAARLADADFDLLGLTMPDEHSVEAALGFLSRWQSARARGREPHVTAGGHYATASAGHLLATAPGLDSVVLYEGEETVCELADRLAEGRDWRATLGIAYHVDGGSRESAPRPKLADLDELPFPARDMLPVLLRADPDTAAAVLSSRGCHRRCSFCRVRSFFGSWRGRSAVNVVDELEVLVRDFNVSRFDFQDDNLVGPGERGRQRAMAIAEEIRRRGIDLTFRIMCSADAVTHDVIARLIDAGLSSVFVGIESGSQTRLTAYRKGTVEQNVRALEVLDRLGILAKSEMGFIMFDPSGSLEEIEENLAFLREHVRFVTPGTLFSAMDGIYTPPDAPERGAFPEPLRLLRRIFMLIALTTRDAYQRAGLGSRDHTGMWRLGVLDIASDAAASMAALVARGNLTADSYQALVAEMRGRAKALSDSMSVPRET
jgi:anaerobic magnesium-protoporphyrin IX monomethyl ester cyclase